jgi:CheY-like chemotaxis protein
MKFTERGSVAVTLDCPADGPLTLVVRDTGIGMTEAQVARVFDDFTQADASTTRRYGGTGLGMSIVRRLVEAMAGEVAIESRPGAGTTIRVALPLPLADGAPVATPATEPAAEGPIRARVLVAEDNEINRMVLEALLARLGVSVVMTRDGGDAVARFRDGGFDALLLDISMPGMDGPEALAAIRAFEAAAGLAPTPAIAVTANALAHQVEAFLAAGFAAHVAKPIEADRLAAALRRVLAAA